MFCWKKMPPTHKTKSISYKSNSGLKFHIPSLKIKPFTSIIQNFSTLSCIFEDIIHFLNIHCKSRKKKKIFKTNVPKTPERRPIGFAKRQCGTTLNSSPSSLLLILTPRLVLRIAVRMECKSYARCSLKIYILLGNGTPSTRYATTAGILQSSNQKKLEISNATYPTIHPLL